MMRREETTVMPTSARCERCRSAATWLCVGTYMLVLVGFDYAAGGKLSLLRLPLIVGAVAAFLLMIVSVAIAIRGEREARGFEVGKATRQHSRRRARHRAGQASVLGPGT